MKRLFYLAIALVMVFALVACSSSADHLEEIKKDGKLEVGTSADYPPFEYVDEIFPNSLCCVFYILFFLCATILDCSQVTGVLSIRGTRGFTPGRFRIMAWITLILALSHGFFAIAWYLGL